MGEGMRHCHRWSGRDVEILALVKCEGATCTAPGDGCRPHSCLPLPLAGLQVAAGA